jgi:maltooligosyltrehalose trehalohydrolase
LTAPFVPMLFQGEEWGAASPFLYFTGFDDENLAAQVREGRRREFAAFGWPADEVPDPQAVSTFERSRLNWDEPVHPAHRELLQWHQALVTLRRQRPSLTDGDYSAVRVDVDEDAGWIVVHRHELVIACNLSAQPCELPLAGDRRRIVLAAPQRGVELQPDTLWLDPESVAIIEIEPLIAEPRRARPGIGERASRRTLERSR